MTADSMFLVKKGMHCITHADQLVDILLLLPRSWKIGNLTSCTPHLLDHWSKRHAQFGGRFCNSNYQDES